MVENLGRKLTLILSLVALALAALAIGGFRLGLDLQGGTRLVYSFDLEKAAQEKKIQQFELQDPTRLLNEVIEIMRQRLDPTGVREPVIRTEGTNRIVIELPGSTAQGRRNLSVTLKGAVDPTATELELAESDAVDELPAAGGQLEVDGEILRYGRRIGQRLTEVTRGYQDTTPEAHADGATASLVALDPWREKLENVGSLAIMMRATGSDVVDLTRQIDLAREWARKNPGAPIADYNRQLAADPATERLRFFPHRKTEKNLDVPLADRLEALVLDKDPAFRFEGDDLRAVYPTIDELGQPAVGFEMSPRDAAATRFGTFTGKHVDEPMAIVISDEIATMPNISQRLPGGGHITGGPGGFTQEEVEDLVTVLRSGSLRLAPKFEAQESVGATLGDEYVRRGLWGAGLSLVTVLGFMVLYYRRLGLFAALSMVVNILLLVGALAFLQATLTLPGVAGIILTVGMAVDANILIFERIREEAARGRKPLQAAKDGFAHALSTIVDANLTTLITALILLKFGTGPVRGFATTLSIGILTTMFAALVVTRVLVHLQLERGIERFSMAHLVGATKIRFLARRKLAIGGSLVTIVAGLVLYSTVSDDEKLGIDFLGGSTMSVRLAEPHTKVEMRALVAQVPGPIGQSSEVKEIRSSAADGGFTRFRITAKGSAGTSTPGTGEAGEGETDNLTHFRNAVTEVLSPYLQKGPIDALEVGGGGARGVLYFEREHGTEDVAALLRDCALTDVSVAPAGSAAAYRFEGKVDERRSASGLEEQITDLTATREDSLRRPMALAQPVDEVNAVGAQVVSELRDKAIFAVLLSLFAAILYIRVRFAEYAYGIAAVVALVHDVLITIGALAFADLFIPFIDAEINLPMIAGFLTIIGYSLNDTIVVFDRIRENLPRMKGSLEEIVDASINQTLSRTLLTSGTTILTVVLILAFNAGTGNVLEGFAFALFVGITVGTYSSIFIASPVLVWLEHRRKRKEDGGGAKRVSETAASPA